MSKTFKLKLIAPDGVKYEQDVDEVVLPTENGQITILPDHTPLIALLKPGEISVSFSGKKESLVSEGGVAEISGNLVKILADTAENIEHLDEEKIAQAKKAAEDRLKNAQNEEEFAEAEAIIAKQLAKLRAISKRKRKY